MSCPRTKNRPSLARVMPESTAASSLWPLPSTPATPTISPRLTMSVKLSRRVTPWRRAPSGRRPAGPRLAGSAFRRRRRLRWPPCASAGSPSIDAADDPASRSRWIIARTRRSISCAGADDSATTRPPRSTVTRFATFLISASLCVTSTTLQPLAATRWQTSRRRFDLVRQQHRGRLVEHEQARVAHQALDDLDALALADRERLDGRHRVEREPVFLREHRERAAHTRCASARRVGLAEHQVLDHRHVGHQAEVLVDHRDALRERLAPGLRGGTARRRSPCRPSPADRRRISGCTASTCRRRSRPGGSGSRPARCRSRRPSSACRLPKRLLTPRSDSSGSRTAAWQPPV